MRHHSRLVTYVRNKLAKVIVDLARQDWPQNYPQFFDSVIQVRITVGFLVSFSSSQLVDDGQESGCSEI